MTIFLNAISAQFYRGIGTEAQYISPFASVNFFIGSNNAGKSTVLRLLADRLHDLSRDVRLSPPQGVEAYRAAKTGQFHIAIGQSPAAVAEAVQSKANFDRFFLSTPHSVLRPTLTSEIESICQKLSRNGYIWVSAKGNHKFELYPPISVDEAAEWTKEWAGVWATLTEQGRGNAREHWIPETLVKVAGAVSTSFPKVHLIPAKRVLGASNETFDDLSGKGLIDHLAELQNPHWDQQEKREKFKNINRFLQEVTGKHTAELEVPFSREHLLVHMDNKVLPLSSLGTGIHEVVLIAAFCTIHDASIMCIEEPEIHLHPLLQKKLINYLVTNTTSQYFIATHSSAFIDTPGANIFHVTNDGVQTRIEPVLTRDEQREILDDLGYLASDILQSNAVIWVEGPSDRIYLNHWISAIEDELQEGVHYNIMFYGGALIRHLPASDNAMSDFIKLRDLNRNMAVILDSDHDREDAPLKPHAQRLQEEMGEGAGMVWVTSGREIENYVDGAKLQAALKEIHPKLYVKPGLVARFDNSFHFYRSNPDKPEHLKKFTGADKVAVAHRICKEEADIGILDLNERIKELAAMIRKANGMRIR